jgi:dimeric dUTPase (all-alpha-NTP-PPase superfamily)
MLEMQLQLQQNHMKDGDPRFLTGNDMANFMRWNAWALEDEVHEAMAEVGWKPWASSRHINQEAFMKEMVDAFHFFMNMLLCGSQGWTPQQIADEFTRAYIRKNHQNAQRQKEGYDGVSQKCPYCHRDLSEVPVPFFSDGLGFCSPGHKEHYLNG